MNEKPSGCIQAAVIGSLLLWLGLAPPGVMFVAHSALSKTVVPGVMAAIAIGVTAVLLLPPFVGAALLTRHRAGWEATAAVAAGLVAIAGYLLLDAAVRAALPASPNWAAALRLCLLAPYALLIIWLAPRLAGVLPRRRRTGGAGSESDLVLQATPAPALQVWLGLTRFDWTTALLALAVAALATIP